MATPRHRKRSSTPPADSTDPHAIDARYGLEPVIEPGREISGDAGDEPCELQRVRCPYCGESFETLVDASAGSATYFEDCHICCRPIEFHLEVDATGNLATLRAHRSD